MKPSKMAPKRCSKQAKLINSEETYKNLALSDALCPICRYILVLPITLPCNHNFCSDCFQGTVANANLTCPLCRVRFASWLRVTKKEDKLVNSKLWDEVQTQFRERVQNRQNGIEENLTEVHAVKVTHGEIRKEYEEQRQKADVELQMEREAEEKASAELISKIQAEDVLQSALIEEKLRLDAKLAKKIAHDIGSTSKYNTLRKRPLHRLIQNMKPKAETSETTQPELPHTAIAPGNTSGAIPKEKSAKQKNLMHFNDVVEAGDSNDSIEDECRFFKPIDHRNIPPSSAVPPIRIPPVLSKMLSRSIEPPASWARLECSDMSAFVRYTNHISRKRKVSEHSRPVKIVKRSHFDKETEQEKKLQHTMTLRERKPSNTTSPTITFISKFLAPTRHDIMTDEEQMHKVRMEQEKADLEFAKKLQEQFNRERYKTRSSLSCRNNIKKPRQLTLREIMSTSGKCK